MLKYFLIILVLINSAFASDYKMLLYDMNKKDIFDLNLPAFEKMLKMKNDVVVLLNVDNAKKLKIALKNKKLIKKYKNNKYFYNTTYFLIDKDITEYHLVKYNGYFVEDFKKLQPMGLFFEKNGVEFLIISINLSGLKKQEQFSIMSKMNKIVEYFAEKETLPVERIVVAGDLGLYTGYLNQLKMMKYKPLSKDKIVFKKNGFKNDNVNVLIHTSGLLTSKSRIIKFTELNIQSHFQYLRFLSDTYPLECDITLDKSSNSLNKRLKAIQEYHLHTNKNLLR